MLYRYGDAWERYPIESGEIWELPDGSRVAVHNLYDPLPGWMRADLLFVDPPWSQGNLRCFYTKAGLVDVRPEFQVFTDMLFARIMESGAHTVYIEIGNQSVVDWKARLGHCFPYIQHWPVLYYRKHPCNLLRGSLDGPTQEDYTEVDEARCIQLLAAREDYRCIADPCMGLGLVGLAAYRAGRRFVGTELNKRRLAVLLDKLVKAGASVRRIE